MSRALKLWLRIQQPRIVSVFHFISYILIAISGLSAIMQAPRSLTDTAGSDLVMWWAWLLFIGGTLGALVVLPGVWWLERAAVLACIGSCLIYAVGIMFLQIQEPGNKVVQICMLFALALLFGNRWFRIRRYSYDPER